MATKSRLQRGGTTNRPFYRFVATAETSARDGKFIEKLGTYDPLAPKDSADRLKIKKDRIEYWLSVGALPSEKVAKFLIALGVKGAEKHKPNFKPKKKGDGLKKKALEKAGKAVEAKAADAPATEETPAAA